MAFTMDNTEGYMQAELNALNAELALRLAEIPEDDTDARAAAEKAFAEEVARRPNPNPDHIDVAVAEIVAGLRNNSRVNGVPIGEHWTASDAVDAYGNGTLNRAETDEVHARIRRYLDRNMATQA